MPKLANQTSFRQGMKRSPESIEKQRRTLKEKIHLGILKPPRNIWTKESKKRMVASMRRARLITHPIGSRRKHKSGHGMIYWQIKVSDRGRWKYEHRIIAERRIGRQLNSTEIVHHMNHDTLDNRNENLQILSHAQHNAHHHPPLINRWSIRFEKCIHCSKTNSRHISKGVCNRCYLRQWRKDRPGYRGASL